MNQSYKSLYIQPISDNRQNYANNVDIEMELDNENNTNKSVIGKVEDSVEKRLNDLNNLLNIISD